VNFAHRNHGGRLTNAQAHKRQRVAHLAAGGAVVGGVALAELAVDIVPKATRECMDPKDENNPSPALDTARKESARVKLARYNHGGCLISAQADKRQRVAHVARRSAVVVVAAQAELAVIVEPKATRESLVMK